MEEHSRRYGLADFRRYHDNRMTPEEQHCFEKRMLEDPFLKEACEGFEMLHEDDIATASVIEKLNRLLPGVEVGRPDSSGKPVWKYMAAATVLFIAAFFSYQRFGEKRDNIPFEKTSEIKSVRAAEERIQQSQAGGKGAAAAVRPPEEAGKENATKPVVPAISKNKDTFPGSVTLSPSGAAGTKGPEAKMDTWRLPGETIQLASGGFRGGEIIVVSDRAIRDKPDSTSESNIVVVAKGKPAEDTIKPGRGSRPDTERMSFGEYLKLVTRNTLKYGESVEFKVFRNGRLEDLTPEEQDSLQKEVMRRREK